VNHYIAVFVLLSVERFKVYRKEFLCVCHFVFDYYFCRK